MKAEVAGDLRAVFNAPSRDDAQAQLRKIAKKYETTAPKLSEGLEAHVPEGLAILAFPSAHQRLLRTTNGFERAINQEIKRRPQVVRVFPNEASCLRLVTAIVLEISEERRTDKAYLSFS